VHCVTVSTHWQTLIFVKGARGTELSTVSKLCVESCLAPVCLGYEVIMEDSTTWLRGLLGIPQVTEVTAVVWGFPPSVSGRSSYKVLFYFVRFVLKFSYDRKF
jgi:hypothetical protein